jgi:AcrR family transcriptional regulator
MAARERRERERASRHALILRTARELAEAQGWDAVTTRRLADLVEYSQPVLYSHFAGKDAIVAAVAVQGFAELGAALEQSGGLPSLAAAYLAFAGEHPALYDAMFAMPTSLAFGGAADTPAELRAAFVPLIEAMRPGGGDAETRAEVLWSALHGLATLTRGHRLRPDHAGERLDLLVEAFTG